jgi:hypothetical protein
MANPPFPLLEIDWDKPTLRTDFTPTAANLTAGLGLANLKTLLIPFGLLDGPHQFRLLQLAHLDAVQLRD